MTPKTESETLKLIYVGECDYGSYEYVVAKTTEEAAEITATHWRENCVEGRDFEAVILGPAPDGILDSDIVDGRIVKAELPLISWLLDRLQDMSAK